MALITCPECRQPMSDTAKSCPHCGFDYQTYIGKVRSRQAMLDRLFETPDRIMIKFPDTYFHGYRSNQYTTFSVGTPKEIKRLIREPRIIWETIPDIRKNRYFYNEQACFEIGENRKLCLKTPLSLRGDLSPVYIDVEPGHVYELYYTSVATGKEVKYISTRVIYHNGDTYYRLEEELQPHVRTLY